MGNNVILRQLKREGITKGGIVLTDKEQERSDEAVVCGVGMDVPWYASTGKDPYPAIAIGEHVLFAPWNAHQVRIEEQPYLIVPFDCIFAKVDESYTEFRP